MIQVLCLSMSLFDPSHRWTCIIERACLYVAQARHVISTPATSKSRLEGQMLYSDASTCQQLVSVGKWNCWGADRNTMQDYPRWVVTRSKSIGRQDQSVRLPCLPCSTSLDGHCSDMLR